MRKLLIAYDGSPQADGALVELRRAGLPDFVRAMVLSVADVWLPAQPPTAPPQGSSSMEESYQQAVSAVAQAQVLAEHGAERLRECFPSWVIEPKSCGDSPPWAVVRQAREYGAELIVVGAHSHSTLQRLFLGSVAGKVAAEASCSVRIGRPRAHPQPPPPRILLAIDGSPDSELAVKTVSSRQWVSGTQVRVITVIDPKLQTTFAYPFTTSEDWIFSDVKDIDEWAALLLGRVTERLGALGLPVESSILHGDPKRVLLHEAEKWDADCIFLGARGRQHGDRLYLGSLANAIANRAHCSVEISR